MDKRIHRTLEAYPGISLRELARETGIAPQTLSDDIQEVVEKGHVRATDGSGGRKHLHLPDWNGNPIHAWLMRDETNSKLVEFVREHPGSSATRIARTIETSLAANTVRYRLAALAEAGLFRVDARDGRSYAFYA